MQAVIGTLAIIGQGLIGSSITRAVFERKLAQKTVITDASKKVRDRLLQLGLGEAKVVETQLEAVKDADMVIICVPVGAIAKVVKTIAPNLKPGAIVSDVGSVKTGVVDACKDLIPEGVEFIPAHPLAGTEFSGPDAGLPRLFVNRWCILTPVDKTSQSAIQTTQKFWQALGSKVEIMSAKRHDRALAITSHLPHLAAFSIIHTGLAQEEKDQSPVMQFSAGAFKDFTRIASSNPVMWRDIFLMNRDAILQSLHSFNEDLAACAKAIEDGDGKQLEQLFSISRLTRRKVVEKEHISLKDKQDEDRKSDTIIRPYSSGD